MVLVGKKECLPLACRGYDNSDLYGGRSSLPGSRACADHSKLVSLRVHDLSADPAERVRRPYSSADGHAQADIQAPSALQISVYMSLLLFNIVIHLNGAARNREVAKFIPSRSELKHNQTSSNKLK